jgi:hypothetical protein
VASQHPSSILAFRIGLKISQLKKNGSNFGGCITYPFSEKTRLIAKKASTL